MRTDVMDKHVPAIPCFSKPIKNFERSTLEQDPGDRLVYCVWGVEMEGILGLNMELQSNSRSRQRHRGPRSPPMNDQSLGYVCSLRASRPGRHCVLCKR